jgi:UDP-N-acetylmuramate--alanine ligase
MTAKILSDIGLDPTVVVGGRVLNQATGARLGTGQYFVAEADESDGSFCLLNPAIAVVTNIDQEHLGHYGDFETLKKAFLNFMNSVPFYGLVVVCIDDPIIESLLVGVERRVMTYGFSEKADVRAYNLKQHGRNLQYKLAVNGCDVAEVSLPLAGAHMALNSLASIGVSLELGAYPDEASKALASFPGVSRRTEEIAIENGILVLDDYGHHPTEIRATLAAVKQSLLPGHSAKPEDSKLVVLFEPHRYTRTQEVFSDFADAFKDADSVYIGDIYSAGEAPIEGISAQSLANSLKHNDVTYVAQLQNAFSDILPKLNTGDVVITLGAGNVGKLGPLLAEQIKAFKKNHYA